MTIVLSRIRMNLNICFMCFAMLVSQSLLAQLDDLVAGSRLLWLGNSRGLNYD